MLGRTGRRIGVTTRGMLVAEAMVGRQGGEEREEREEREEEGAGEAWRSESVPEHVNYGRAGGTRPPQGWVGRGRARVSREGISYVRGGQRSESESKENQEGLGSSAVFGGGVDGG